MLRWYEDDETLGERLGRFRQLQTLSPQEIEELEALGYVRP